MKIERDGDRYIARTAYEEREYFQKRRSAWRWDRDDRVWVATSLEAVAPLAQHATDEVRGDLAALAGARQGNVDASRAIDAELDVPLRDGCVLRPFQKAGVVYMLARPATLLGDDMGLGKTVQSLVLINALPTLARNLVICPASLKLNWAREARKWLTRPTQICVVSGADGWPVYLERARNVLVIVNYDVLAKHYEPLRRETWDLLMIDECHYLKNEHALRTVHALGGKLPLKKTERAEGKKPIELLEIPRRRLVAMTGTPIPNYPIELWSIVKAIDPQGLGANYFRFAVKYCGAKKGRFGIDTKGTAIPVAELEKKLADLQREMRSRFLIRRRKADVLKELPPKQRQVIELPQNGHAPMIAEQLRNHQAQKDRLVELKLAVELARVSEIEDEYRDAVAALRAGVSAALAEMSKLRHETAIAMLPDMIDHVRGAIEGGKVIVFAHHHAVLNGFSEAFGDRAVRVDGAVPMPARQLAVDRFQNDHRVSLFLGQMKAAGVGLTLTASSHVVFAEPDWVPSTLSQAEDRAHRIGQRDSVLVQHFVIERSLFATMLQRCLAKQEIIDRALDVGAGVQVDPLFDPEQAAALETGLIGDSERSEAGSGAGTTREVLAREAAQLSAGQVAAIHDGLKMLAGLCDGAQLLDGAGFSKFDAEIGRKLAQLPALTPRQAALGKRLVSRYRRQLPDAVIEGAGLARAA